MPLSTSNRARWFSTCTSCTPASASSPAGWRTVLTSIDVRVTWRRSARLPVSTADDAHAESSTVRGLLELPGLIQRWRDR
jgi:hypothetical protein